MEEPTLNGCILLKRKEYEDLKNELETLKSAQKDNIITLKWDTGYANSSLAKLYLLDFPKTISLSGNIQKQLRRLIATISDKQALIYEAHSSNQLKLLKESKNSVIARLVEDKKVLERHGKILSIVQFQELSLIKRIWFRSKYIKVD